MWFESNIFLSQKKTNKSVRDPSRKHILAIKAISLRVSVIFSFQLLPVLSFKFKLINPYSTVFLKFNSKKKFFRITSTFLLFLN